MLRKGWKKKRKLSRDEFAKKCGVSKMAISKAVKAGKVVEDDQGKVNTADPTNRAYMQADHAVMKRAKAAGKRSAGRGERSKSMAEWRLRKTKADAENKEQQTALTIQRRARELGLLVEIAMIRKRDAAVGAEIKLRILGLPRQIAQELFDLAHSKGATPMAIEGLLLERLSDALVHVKEKGRIENQDTLGL